MWDVLIATPMDIIDGLLKTVDSFAVQVTFAILTIVVTFALVIVIAASTVRPR